MKKLLSILALTLAFTSCSNDSDAPTAAILPTFELNGLFKMDTSYSTDDENFLFENNRLFIGNEAGTIHQELVVGSNLLNDAVAFTFNSATNKINFTYSSNLWEGTYEPTTGKIINGVVKSANGLVVVASFNGQKYIPQASGTNLFNGHWKGNFGSGTNVPSNFFNVIVENGFLVVTSQSENTLDNGTPSRYGLSLNTPVINDKTITCIYQYIGGQTFSLQATYNPTTKKLEGTWGSGINTSGGGTVIFEPQNFN